MHSLLLISAIVLGQPANDAYAEALKAFRSQDYKAARVAAETAAREQPKRIEAQELLGAICLQLKDNTAAAKAFQKVVTINPKSISGYDRLGDALLKSGQFKESVAAFDKMLELKPDFAPEHWRRGIALYYAERYADGAKQFETHKTANPEDVENAAWHYLCNSRVVGKEKARGELIDVTKDTRVPMAEIQKLFAGKLTPDDVLKVADKVADGTPSGIEARFYAHLYVALWYEGEGDVKKTQEHMTLAAEKYKIGHYMWDIAVVHQQLLNKKPAEPK